MSFSLVNTTQDTILYYQGDNIIPVIVFEISNKDTTIFEPSVASHVGITRYLLPGDTLSGQWKVTNFLTPGSYKANVWVPDFSKVKGVAPVSAISLSIIQ